LTRHGAFDDEKARAAWNEAARAWEGFVESGADYYRHEVHGPALLAACQPLQRLKVLDLGCGQGFFSRQLAAQGARVVGIDIADELLALARGHEEREPLGISYHLINAKDVDRQWPAGSFDLITGCMSLQDMAAPGEILSSALKALKPRGVDALFCSAPVHEHPIS
jgi:2-polyprenyl-3-methyl-5-hydroxy-6-metoxy-1,4-benzoquinol methylase